jgi:hypothetical protein
MTLTRTLNQFLGHGAASSVRITLCREYRYGSGRGAGRNLAAILANGGEYVVHG